MPRLSNEQIIRRVKSIRTKNNSKWMALLALAVKTNPRKAKKILSQISAYDAQVTQWMRRIH
jgi:hypothetical protein